MTSCTSLICGTERERGEGGIGEGRGRERERERERINIQCLYYTSTYVLCIYIKYTYQCILFTHIVANPEAKVCNNSDLCLSECK